MGCKASYGYCAMLATEVQRYWEADYSSSCPDCQGSMRVFTRKLKRRWLLGMESLEPDVEPAKKVDMGKAHLAGLWHRGMLSRTIWPAWP